MQPPTEVLPVAMSAILSRGQEKVALSMHLSRVLYISKLPLVKSKAKLPGNDLVSA